MTKPNKNGDLFIAHTGPIKESHLDKLVKVTLNQPTVKPVVGGWYITRNGKTKFLPNSIWLNPDIGYQSDGHWKANKKPHPEDLIELIAFTVPVAELAQLRRAQAFAVAFEGGVNVEWSERYQDWLAHHREGKP